MQKSFSTLLMHKDAKIFEKHLNPVMLVFIGKLSLSTNVPGFQSFGEISHQQYMYKTDNCAIIV